MGYFVGYRHTGAAPERLAELLPAVRDAISDAGHEVYCTYFDEDSFRQDGYGPREIMSHAFGEIDRLGGLFVVIDSDEKSEGMLLEAGYCIAKGIGFTVAKRAGVTTYLDQLATTSFEYQDIPDLIGKIGDNI
ncbi:hypothetical protein E6P97_00390 [Patescibacteria group bacterium]|nr:MAG: hypothetical protein E6P97_00390 [Patescibacteria group bacterium]